MARKDTQTPPGTFAPEFAISPDGTKLAFVATSTNSESTPYGFDRWARSRLNGSDGTEERALSFLVAGLPIDRIPLRQQVENDASGRRRSAVDL